LHIFRNFRHFNGINLSTIIISQGVTKGNTYIRLQFCAFDESERMVLTNNSDGDVGSGQFLNKLSNFKDKHYKRHFDVPDSLQDNPE
jgi:hypothetical protein